MAHQNLFLKFTIIALLFVVRLCWGWSEGEAEALLVFKAGLNDSHDILSSWVKETDCCLWYGISCDNNTNHVVMVQMPSTVHGGVMSNSLCNLNFVTSLNLGANGLTGTIPSCLGNLSYLIEMNLGWNRLSGNIPLSFANISSLTILYLARNILVGETVLNTICMLSNLREVSLDENQLNGSLPSCLGSLSFLTHLSLATNKLTGIIPSSLSNLSSLLHLDLGNNHLSGNIPYSLGKMSSLNRFDVYNNGLSGQIPDSLGNLSSLVYLRLAYNQLNGTLPPSFSRLSSLTTLDAYGNTFNQSSPSWPLPTSLNSLSLSLNGHQIVSEASFHNLSKLENLFLSNCVLNISTSWIPSFQLETLHMTSCKMDGQIPLWISTQFKLGDLQLADNNLVGEIPSWLQDMSLSFINLTANHLQGRLLVNSSAWTRMMIFDVSRNAFWGQIPSVWPPNMLILMLNDNNLTGNIPPSLQLSPSLQMLNLANNHLNGIIPPSLTNYTVLQVLNLGNNNLEGVIPSFGELTILRSLVIKNNKITGSFPSSISKCKELFFLDMGQNLLKGGIPKSIGNLSKLQVLVMRQNKFGRSIPPEIGQLKLLQILDLSSNRLSGFIPHSILCLQAMVEETQQGFIMGQIWPGILDVGLLLSKPVGDMYHDGLDMNSKGVNQHYSYIFPTMTSIDLSDNQLSGNVPSDFGKLKGLMFLNLSMNNLNGTIPNSLGEMRWMESLDLSTNQLSGQIPWELGSLSSLGVLNLSNNNLSGIIPQRPQMSTFTKSSYSGNPNLWGCPLPKNCSWPEYAHPPNSVSTNEEEKSKETQETLWYEIGVGLSYGVGFGGMLSFLVLRINCRKKYFEGVDLILKFLFPWLRNLKL